MRKAMPCDEIAKLTIHLCLWKVQSAFDEGVCEMRILIGGQKHFGESVFTLCREQGLVVAVATPELSNSTATMGTMQLLPKVGRPVILQPVESCLKSVTVGNVIAGAHVDVYVNGAWRGSAIATGATVEVPIQFGPLNICDEIAARQCICHAIGGPGEPVKIISSAGFYNTTQQFDVSHPGWNPWETLPLGFEAQVHAND